MRNVRRRLATLCVLVCVGAAPATAEVYRWTDAEGRLHFSQHLDQVPREQRPAAREAARLDARPESADRFQTFEAPVRPTSASGSTFGKRSLRIPFEREGTLMRVHVQLNDALRVPFLIDTGASGISIPASVAGQLGLLGGDNLGSRLVRTANGLVTRSVVRLDAVEVGGARVEGLDATVNPSMSVGLLGGTFFNNFIYRVDAAEQVITLQANDGIRGGVGAEQWRERFRAIREPIDRLNAYLEETEISGDARRRHLEERLASLEQSLEALELEANRATVPASWRD
jgi:clan AA aspartic protease (TIGR02281 family)